MSTSLWKGWAVNGRPNRADGEVSPRRERSGGAAASQHPGLTQAPGYDSPVAWQGWSALRQDPALVTPTTRAGWGNGQEIAAVPVQPTAVENPRPGLITSPGYGSPVLWQGWSVIHQEPAAGAPATWEGWTRGQEPAGVPAQPTPSDEHLSDPPKPAFLAGVAALEASTPAVSVPLFESVAAVRQRSDLGKRTEARYSMLPLQKGSHSLAEAVARSREERKFSLVDYTAVLRVVKTKGEKFVEDEIADEGLSEAVDKFALSLTNKDYQMALGMSTEEFYGMNAEYRLRAMHYK
jgi:hypothetical protein